MKQFYHILFDYINNLCMSAYMIIDKHLVNKHLIKLFTQ